MGNAWLATLERRVMLRGWVETRTGLHVGAGRSLAATGTDSPVVKNIDARPLIPGSSFKGAVRAQIEGIVHSLNTAGKFGLRCCQGKNADQPCDVVAGKYCVPRDEWDRQRRESEDNWVERLLNEATGACHVCRLFGAPYLASSVCFADLAVSPGYWHPHLLQVRDGVAIERDSLTAASRKKFDFEVIPPEVRFDLEIALDNADDYEIGLLLWAFQQFNEGHAFLGGQKSRGLGQVWIAVSKLEVIKPMDMLSPPSERSAECGEAEDHLDEYLRKYLPILRDKIEAKEAKEEDTDVPADSEPCSA